MRASLLWPLHWLRLLSVDNDFTANPVLGHPGLNARGLQTTRMRLAEGLSRVRRAWLARGLSPEAVRRLDDDGLLVLENFLDEADFEAVKAQVVDAALPVLEMSQPPALTRRINLDAASCEGRYPALPKLTRSRPLKRLLQYAAGYSGTPLIAVQVIHATHDEAAAGHDPQTDWHLDTFHSTAKAWLFLHEVGPQDGPFAFVPGSHRLTPQRLRWIRAQSATAAGHPNRLHAKGSFRTTPAEMSDMHMNAPWTAAVAANTLVVANTSGFHRRTPSARNTVRIEVYLSLRRNPFFAGLYPSVLSLPVLRRHWAGWVYAWSVHRWRIGKPGWIPAAEPGLREDERRMLRPSPAPAPAAVPTHATAVRPAARSPA